MSKMTMIYEGKRYFLKPVNEDVESDMEAPVSEGNVDEMSEGVNSLATTRDRTGEVFNGHRVLKTIGEYDLVWFPDHQTIFINKSGTGHTVDVIDLKKV